MKAPISLCMITRRDPHLEACLKSIAEYVEEICIVVNDPDDTDSVEVAKKFGAKVQLFTACNDSEGRIKDFSQARNASLDMATQPWIMWCDSDDLVSGGEKLAELVQKTPAGCALLFPYEYSYTDTGAVTCRHYRERLVRKGTCHFVNPVHEVMVAKEGVLVNFIMSDELVFKHQRQYIAKPAESNRNLRILKEHVAANPDDIRNKYYIGLEYSNSGDNENAIKYLSEYVDKSGWDDERAMACLKLVEIYQIAKDYKNGLKWAYKCLEIKDWFESYYAICRMHYLQNNWSRAAHYGKQAIVMPPTQTLLFINEIDRYAIHTYLNVALNNIGDVVGALASVEEGLKGLPTDPNLVHNRTIYRNHLNVSVQPLQPLVKKDLVEKDLDPAHLEIVFVAGLSYERWDPGSVKKTGIGGSESMMIQQARNLAELGHKVTVYGSPFEAGKVFDGVTYEDIGTFGNVACDVLVVSRYAQFLGDQFNVKAKLRLLWLHDVCAINATSDLLLKADRILCLSQWHKDNVVKVHNVHPDQVVVTRNGIDLDKFQGGPPKNKFRCINSSSPDRSWAVLLEVFPEIRKRVPQAELHLFYGFENWRKAAANDRLQLDLIDKLEFQVKNTEGVHYHGRVSEDRLIEEFQQSGVWTHPTWFTETSCITAMQAIAAGCHIVTSNIAALKETVLPEIQRQGYAKLLDGDWTSPEYKEKFINCVVEAMNQTERFYPLLSDKFGLKSLAKDWNRMFLELIETRKTAPLIPYQPTKHYNKRKSELVKLNIAAGPNVFPYDGWVNIDKYDFKSYFDYVSNPNVPLTGMPPHQQELATFLREGGDFRFEQHDMTKPFTQFKDNGADLIYVGQAIEHLNYVSQVPAFLKECFRMLKPGGVLRMTTPDLDKLIRAFSMNRMSDFAADQPAFFKDLDRTAQLSLLMFGSAGPDCTQEKYEGHFFCYSEESMKKVLEDAGFSKVTFECKPHPEIRDEGLSHSLVVEAVKP